MESLDWLQENGAAPLLASGGDPEGGKGQGCGADEASDNVPFPSELIDLLAELQVRRKFYINAVNRQTNAAGALVRRALGWRTEASEDDRESVKGRAARIVAAALAGKPQKAADAEVAQAVAADLAIVAASIEPLLKVRGEVELQMKKATRRLPVHAWAKGVQGFGELGLAVIVGEAGDLARFPAKGHLWKRFGLAPHQGKAYSTWRSSGGLTSEDWIAAGYSPRRRAEMFAVIGDPLFRRQSMVGGPYRAVYDRRRAATAISHPDWTKAHSHADALRVMTKFLLRDLWREWRRGHARRAPIEGHCTCASPPQSHLDTGGEVQ